MSKKRHWRLLNVNLRYTNGKDPVPTCCLLACLDALLSRHTLRWSDWLIWPVNHQHRQMVYPISNQYFRPLPKALQRSDSRWKCWANANHSIWRSQVIADYHYHWQIMTGCLVGEWLGVDSSGGVVGTGVNQLLFPPITCLWEGR